ncbi:MAG: ParB/RepB/Spo0J family partition protein [Pyrinomonadaceae bacterium]
MSKKGLPTTVKMRHDSHYVEDLTRSHRSVGKNIPISQIEPNPSQPRVEIGDLTDLSSSIKEKGVLEPLLVKPNNDGTWMIIAGERRWRAATRAGLREVPCIELDLDEKGVAEIALIENMQRKDLTVWEEADGLANLASRFGHTHEEISKKIGKSRTTVTESLTIAGLPADIRTECRRLDINAKSTLLEIARQFDESAMHKFLKELAAKGSSRETVRETARPKKSLADQFKTGKTSKTAPIDQGNNFEYVSEDNRFSLKIYFEADAEADRKFILLALKETFDSVKNNQ